VETHLQNLLSSLGCTLTGTIAPREENGNLKEDKMRIRQASIDDVTNIAQVHVASWLE
jgi:hypothetical protein